MTVETFKIFPSNKHNRPAPPSKVAFHGLDLMGAPIQIRNHRFFHPPTDTTFDHVVENLKSSLAEALELYPPVAGTLEMDRDGEIHSAMGPEFNKGTPFLVERKETPYQGDADDVGPRTDVLLPHTSDILQVKVTQFSCGAIAVASSLNHQISDLRGFLDFLELWACIARGEAVDFNSIPDNWSRTPGRFFLGLTKESAPKAPAPFSVLDKPVTGPSAYLLVPSVATIWDFTKSDMERLKKDLSSSQQHTPNGWISSGDALAALLCGVITRARERACVPRLEGRSTKKELHEQIAMAADGRDRAPRGDMAGGHYFGNFNPLWNATISRTDLLEATCASASRVAAAIRAALTTELSPEAVAYKISFFQDPQNTVPRGRISWTADMILTNWCRFDLKGPKLDLGWGKPFHATSGSGGSFPPGYCLMTHDHESQATTVLMTVEGDGVENLKTDTLLNSYATLISE
ncbi:transferase [Parasitella parasitica]|nr:transferase [Parasitella parasitica]